MQRGPSQQRKCEQCGKQFIPREPHHRTCYDCFQGSFSGRGSSSAATAGRMTSALVPSEGYLAQGYFDKQGHVRPEILEMREARPEAGSSSMVSRAVYALMTERVQGQAIAFTQLYKFYQQARATERRLREGEPFAAIIAELVALRPKAAVVVGRKVAPQCFKDFIDTNVELARESEQGLRDGFLQHYQAVLCYYRYFSEIGRV